MVDIQKLRIFAMLMRFKEIQQERIRAFKDYERSIKELNHVIKPTVLALQDFSKESKKAKIISDEFFSLPQKQKHRKKRKFHN